MLLFAAFLSFVLGLALGETPCGMPSTTRTFEQVVMAYTPFMTPQVAPVSTIWEAIVTTWYNAVDCRYVTPLRIDANPVAEGPFTTYVRSPTLTVTRVGCMPETTAVTRRDIRGENQFELRSVEVPMSPKVQKRTLEEQAIDKAVNDLPDTFPPDVTSLTVQAFLYLTSVNTAIFAINLIQAGVDLNQTCLQLRDPAAQAKLFRTTIDPVQAGDIVCFAATNGLYFADPVTEVVTYLADLVYAIQVRANYPDDSDAFCWPLDIINSPWLGMDIDGISKYLCASNPLPVTSTFVSATGTTEPTGTAASGTGSVAPPPTGGPYANTTAAGTTVTSETGANITTFSATATPGPYANSTVSASGINSTTDITGTVTTWGTSIIFPNATYTSIDTATYTPVDNSTYTSTSNATSSGENPSTAAGTGDVLGTGTGGVNLPPLETSISPPIESVTSSPTRRFRRW